MAEDKIKVLVIDDSALVRKMLSDILETDKHIEVVGTAADPLQAREKIKKLNPDVLTLDVEMPNMDGITATRKIRELPGKRGRTPIIGLTANAMASDRDTLIEVGMDGYLPKPVRKELLKASILGVLQG